MNSLWGTINFISYGCLAPFISDIDKDKETYKIPNEIVTRKLFITVIVVTIFFLVEFFVRSLWMKRKGWGKWLDENMPSVLEGLAKKHKSSISNWVDKNFVKYKPTFYEEYLFYKYYYKMGGWALKKKLIDYLPNELKKLAEEAKKDYLTFRLAGLKE